jgi:hypothetical protein
MGIRSRDLPACSIVPQPTTLPRAPGINIKNTVSHPRSLTLGLVLWLDTWLLTGRGNYSNANQLFASHGGRAVYGMKYVRSLEHWDRGFESHLWHGCLRLFCLCVGSGLATA